MLMSFIPLTDGLRNEAAQAKMETMLDTLGETALSEMNLLTMDVLADRAPERFAQWGVSKIETLGLDEPIRTAAQRWIANDAAGAVAWIESMPTGRGRDAALEGGVKALIPTDTPAAAAWVEQIGDAARRRALVPKIVEQWTQRDPSAAEAWRKKMQAR